MQSAELSPALRDLSKAPKYSSGSYFGLKGKKPALPLCTFLMIFPAPDPAPPPPWKTHPQEIKGENRPPLPHRECNSALEVIPQGQKASAALGELKSRQEEMLCSEQLCPAGAPHGFWGLCTSSQWGLGGSLDTKRLSLSQFGFQCSQFSFQWSQFSFQCDNFYYRAKPVRFDHEFR